MPEYLAPGVYVEETSFRARSIQGVGTSTTGFVGLARKGPTDGLPELVTSFGEFERMFGGLGALDLPGATTDTTSYMAYAARAFFNEGGSRLYVARVFLDRAGGQAGGQAQSAALGNSRFRSRHPGSAYAGVVRVTERALPASDRALETAPVGSLARVGSAASPSAYHVREAGGWRAYARADANAPWTAANNTAASLDLDDEADALVTVDVEIVDSDAQSLSYEGLGLDPSHPRALSRALPETPTRRSDLTALPYLFVQGNTNAPQLHTLLMTAPAGDADPAVVGAVTAGADGSRTRSLPLTGGHDGRTPALAQWQAALDRLNDWDDIAIIAAPGASAFADTTQAVQNALISHAENSRFRIAVLDPEPNLDLAAIRLARGRVDSTYAALYYPWVVITNPQARPGNEAIAKEVALPPSGACLRHLRPQRRAARRLEDARQRGRARGDPLRARGQPRPAGGAEPARHQLPAHLLRARQPGLWRPPRDLRPRGRLCQRPPLPELPEALDRRVDAVGGVRAERTAPLGQCARCGLELPLHRVAQRRAARRQPRAGVLRPLRPLDHDPGRSR